MPTINGVNNSYANLVPYLLREFKIKFREQINLAQTILIDGVGMAAAKNEVIHVNTAEDLLVTDVAPSLTIPDAQEQEFYDTKIKLAYWKEARTKFKERELSIQGVRDDLIPPAMEKSAQALADWLNQLVISELKKTPNIVTTTATVISSYADIVALNKKLSLRAPTSDRVMVFGRESEANILMQPQFLTVDYHAKSKTIMNGVIGNRLGFDFLPVNTQNNLMVSEIAGDITFTVGNFPANRDVAVVANTVGVADGKTYNPGNILEVIEIDAQDVTSKPLDSRLLVVSEGGTVASDVASIYIRAGADFTDLSNGITIKCKMIKVVDEGFAYQKQAMTLVSRPSIPLGFREGSGSVHDKGTSLNYSLMTERAHRLFFMSLDLLCGIQMTDPEFASRHVQYDPADQYVT